MGVSRRAALAGGASLIAVGGLRKPRAEEAPIGRLVLADPPRGLPDLRWVDAAGVGRRLGEYAGQGVILNFWATWCAPCVAEMPSLAALAPQLAADRIAVLPVSSDAQGAGAVQRFYADHHIAGLGVWLDPKGAAPELIGAVGLPTTLIVNRAGREVGRIAGAADWNAPGTAQTLRVLCAV